MRKFFIWIILVFSGVNGFSQSWEIGITPGISYYVGDLNPTGHFLFPNPAGALFARKNFNYHWSIRMGANYHKVNAVDSISPWEFQQFRNLSFESHIFEFNALCELNFFPYRPGNVKKYNWTPYLFAGLAVFYHSPQTSYNGVLVSLDQYGTEGQQIPGSGNRPYSMVQPAIPFGMGFKVNVGKRISLGLEWGYRVLFTDYLDDVSTVYADKQELFLVGGQVAVELSDKTGSDGNLTGFQRGFSKTKDWYSFLGVSLVINIPDYIPCPGYDKRPKPWYKF